MGIATACILFMGAASWLTPRHDYHRLRCFVAEVTVRQAADRARQQSDATELGASVEWSDPQAAAGLCSDQPGKYGHAAVLQWLDDARRMRDAVQLHSTADVVALFDRWSPADLAALDVPALRWLASELERLDAGWPLHEDVAAWLAGSAGFWLDEGKTHPPDTEERLRAWRRGFDVRAEALVTCELLLARLPALSPSADDWPARKQQWCAFLDDLCDRCSGDVLWCMYHLEEVEQTRFAGLAGLRLLRLATAFLLGEQLPRLGDPFAADVLQVEPRGDEATFRSASTDPVLVRHATRR